VCPRLEAAAPISIVIPTWTWARSPQSASVPEPACLLACLPACLPTTRRQAYCLTGHPSLSSSSCSLAQSSLLCRRQHIATRRSILTMMTPRSHRGRATRGPPPPGPSHAGAHYYNQRPDSFGVASQYGRPTSSVYSQPSPQAAVLAAQQLRRDHSHGLYHQRDPLEISPPSSPDVASPRNG